ncbi:hypothetical protein KKH59_04845, partial [Patescibacteria group bacterium]|nr:hypothetical protein [Patescibacteria group bacterium]
MIFGKFGNKKILISILGIVFLVLGFWLVQAPKAEAATNRGNYITVKLDVDSDKEQWGFFNSAGDYGDFNVSALDYSTTYTCALLITEERDAANDHDYIVWVANQKILSSINNNSLAIDIGTSYQECCSTSGSTACDMDSGGNCVWTDGAKRVFDKVYGTGWTNKCSSDTGSSCSLSYGTEVYRPKTNLLCETQWRQCDSLETSCQTYNDRQYACNSGVWTNCTGTTPNCSAGACEAATTDCSGSVSLSLSPSTVSPSGSVTPSAAGLTACNSKVVSFREGSCAGTEKSSCTIPAAGTGCTGGSFTAPVAAGTYTYYACVDKNSDSDYSDSGEQGSAPLTVVSCPAGFSVSFGSAKYSKNDNFTITYSANSDGCVSIDRITGGVHNFWDETIFGSGSKTNYNTSVSGGSYVSVGTIVRATINKSSSWTCDVSSTCKAEITIVECTKDSDCTSNDCNLTTYTCNLATTPCSDPTKYVSGTVYAGGPSITTGSVTITCPSCSYTDSIVAGDGGNYAANRSTTIGEVCTVTAVSTDPCYNASSTTFTVSAVNPTIDFNLSIPCASPPPPGATCAAGDGCVPTGCTPPDPDCATGPAVLLNPLKCTDIVCLIDLVVNFIFYISLPIVILMLVIAAFLFMT